METIPQFSQDLIRILDEEYPERCPALTDSDRQVWAYTGKRELVRLLVLRLEQEKEKTINGS